jgi:hypothetical protein
MQIIAKKAVTPQLIVIEAVFDRDRADKHHRGKHSQDDDKKELTIKVLVLC